MNTRQRGSTSVEFALVFLLLLGFLLGILDFARLLYTWNAANETARAGARYAVVCADPTNKARILATMQGLMPQISDIDVAWQPANCDATNCESVTVSITGLQFRWIAPIPSLLATPLVMLPGFSTYLPREMMTYNPLIC
ncbi:pilus assembly protein [Massilia sp. TW-1]|uniref:Pilus assembly protein n=1 Tax=Telluria antibiotica TaxID=2717319 RepID=A0ABX0PCU5_9BURK|nr:TadE/TadG family type IV pilus assembly protein [Telluria antibiotica]NIA55175.1 pilus assembly protein [Telluria antibiotica]